MMEKLMAHAETIARQAQESQMRRIADRLRTVLGNASVEVRETGLLVRGQGLVKRWLLDPSLRFLGGDLK